MGHSGGPSTCIVTTSSPNEEMLISRTFSMHFAMIYWHCRRNIISCLNKSPASPLSVLQTRRKSQHAVRTDLQNTVSNLQSGYFSW